MPQVQKIGRPQGGVIGKDNVPSVVRASGLWRVGDVLQARTTEDWPVTPLPANLITEDTKIGRPIEGEGFFAGIIDTNQSGAILPEDQYQTPLRYALIVSSRSLQNNAQWRTSLATVTQARTRWNGLAVQEALMPDSRFPAFEYCQSLPFLNDGASRWYLPALDELTEAYWNLKPTTGPNATGTTGPSDFPNDSFQRGELFSSVPQRPPFTFGTPEQTDVTDFQDGGDEEFVEVDGTSRAFWSASWLNSSIAWDVGFSNGLPLVSGLQTNTLRVRPFRRFILPS